MLLLWRIFLADQTPQSLPSSFESQWTQMMDSDSRLIYHSPMEMRDRERKKGSMFYSTVLNPAKPLKPVDTKLHFPFLLFIAFQLKLETWAYSCHARWHCYHGSSFGFAWFWLLKGVKKGLKGSSVASLLALGHGLQKKNGQPTFVEYKRPGTGYRRVNDHTKLTGEADNLVYNGKATA